MAEPDATAPNDVVTEKPQKPDRSRLIPLAIVVLATVIGFVSVAGLWVKRQALETDTFTRTSAELLDSEAIRGALADFVVTTIYDNVDVEEQVAGKLPPQIQGLAAPAAAGLRELATNVTEELLSRPKTQALWENATRAAQERLIALLDDKGEFVSTGGGTVTLDLTGLVSAAAAETGIGGNLASKLPADASQIEILRSDELAAAQTGFKALRALAYILTFLTLLLYALAIFLARGRRRETLRAVGYSFAFIGILVLLCRNIASNIVVDSLAGDPTVEPAVKDAWEISTSLLVDTAQSLVAYGIVIVLAAFLAGPTRAATAVRHAMTPYLRQPAIAFAGAATILILLFWWNPVIATNRLVPSLLLALLIFIGVEALRRQVIREFPDHTETGGLHIPAIPTGVLRHADAVGGPSGDDRIGQLERLAHLHEKGLLDDAELAQEKQRILSTAGD